MPLQLLPLSPSVFSHSVDIGLTHVTYFDQRSFIGYDDPSKICNRLLLETKTTQPDFTIFSYLKSLWKTVICCDRDTSQSLFFLGKSFLGTRVLGVLKVKVLSSRSSVCLYLGKDLCNGYFRNHPDMAEFQSITEIRKTNTLI